MEVAIKKALLMRSTLYKDIDASILSSLSSIADNLKFDAKSLASSFDKFMTVSRQESTAVTMDDVETFNREHQATKAAKSHNNLFARQNWEDLDKDDIQDSAKAGHRISPYLSKISSAPSKTNANAVVVPKLEQPLGTGAFKDRCNNGSIQSILNDHIEVATTSTTTPCDIQILGHPIDINARYMMDRLANKAAYIHHRISTIESDIDASTAEGIPLPIGTAAQQKSLFVGRVCCDTEEGRLNPQSVLLEGSSTLSHGARVRVDLASCPEYRLFPGQVVVVRGTNPSGFCIAANNVLSGAPLPFNGSMDVDTVAMSTCIVASGPYTTTENLSYEPLAALLEHCKACQPDMLLLAGPFVDAEHPCLKDGLFEETFEEIFASRVLSQLASFSGAVGEKTKILLVPSPKDAHHDPVYPQRPMKVVQDDDGQEITTNLSNPSMFSCNGVVLGCSSVDWLMSCTKEEISRSEKPVDRLPTMAMHLVHQRSFFPMYPPPIGLPMDTTLGYGLEFSCTPNILISPSDLAPFAKSMPLKKPVGLNADDQVTHALQQEGSVVCINPGRLTKGVGAGTFAQVYFVPSGESMNEVDKYCRVEIRKL